MPTTDIQRKRADEIASEYSESVRITPNAGPLRDLCVVACPDGRTVVLTSHGTILADSAQPSSWDQRMSRGPWDTTTDPKERK